MQGGGEVWAVVSGRLEELLTLLNLDSAEPESTETLCALQGLAVLLHLSARCSSPIRYHTSNSGNADLAFL